MRAEQSPGAAIGIDLGGTNVRVALVEASGKVLAHRKTPTPVSAGPQATVDVMARLIQEITAQEKTTVLGVGVGSPGPLSRTEKKLFRTANLPGFENFSLGLALEKKTGLPVLLDNDAKCATYGEGRFGAARGLKHYILMTFGTGIGGGLVVDGHMIYGKTDGACEVGHMTLYPEGELCGCGNRGCFERYASSIALERRWKEKSGSALSARDILEAYVRQEPLARDVVSAFVRDVAVGAASLINIFDPEAVLLGGGLFSSGGGPLISLLEAELKTRAFESSLRGLRLMPAQLGDDAGVLGAATLVFQSML